jgi:uncharacterized membrane protein
MTRPAAAGRGRHGAPAPITADRLVAALAGVALLISLYLAVTQIAGSNAVFCERGGGCDVVQSSRWATFFAAPTAAWGAVHFALLLALALAGYTARRWLLAFVLAAVGVAFTGYLTWIELGVLRAVCPYCLAVAALAVAILVALVVRRPHAVQNRRWGRPGRLAAIGAVTALVTVVVGAAAFLAETPREASSRQEAVAQHLKAGGAVFYGAYW